MTQTADAEMPFPTATGRGIRIAVIDSGVNINHPHILAATTFPLVLEGGESPEGAEDRLGHGTAVTAAIQEKAPAATYYALKLFGPTLRSTGDRLIQAIEWAVENEMDVVNLSLGTPNFDYEGGLRELASRCVIVSAQAVDRSPILPGCLDNAIGVDVDWDLPRNRYWIEREGVRRPVFRCSGYPRPLPGLPQTRNLHGVSFAVANMTGFVARAMEVSQTRDLHFLYEVLEAEVSPPPISG